MKGYNQMKQSPEYLTCDNNRLGITPDALEATYKMPRKTIDNGMSLFKNKKSKSWAFVIIDKLKYILLDRIPKDTLENYKIPTTLTDITKEIDLRKEDDYSSKETEIILSQELTKFCLEDGPWFVDNYLKLKKEKRLTYATVEAACHFVIDKIQLGIPIEQLYNVIKCNCRKFCSKSNELNLLFNPGGNSKYFKKKIERGAANGFYEVLVNGNTNKVSEKRIDQEASEWVVSQLTNPDALKMTNISKKLDSETTFQVSYRSIRRINDKRKELASAATKGIEDYKNNRAPYFKGRKPKNKGDYAEADGTRDQFVCKDRSGDIIFERSYTILDGYSGFKTSCIGLSENTELALATFKLFVKRYGILPREIKYDGASAHKSERFKKFIADTKKMGVVWRPSRSSPGLAYVERHHLTYLTRTANGKEFFVGEGIKSKHERSRPSPEQIAYYRAKDNLITQDELHSLFYKHEHEFNNDIIAESKIDNKMSAQVRWNKSDALNAVKVSPEEFIILFGETKEETVQKGIITFKDEVTGITYDFSVYTLELLEKVNFKKIIIRYDPADMKLAYLFSINNEFLSTIIPTPSGEKTKFNQSEEGEKNLQFHCTEKARLIKDIETQLAHYKKMREAHEESKIPIELVSGYDEKDIMDEANRTYFDSTTKRVELETEKKRNAKQQVKTGHEPVTRTQLPAGLRSDARKNAQNYQ
jgi:hypothetical protein